MTILGISAFYHDSAAVLIRDGDIIAAAQEERFSRKKHDDRFPRHAVDYCLKEAGIASKDLDYVAFYEKPFLKFERLLETYLTYAPRGFRSFAMAMPTWLKEKLWMKSYLAQELNFKGRIIFPEHHESHAASAFFPSPFREAAFLTMDGVGEWATASFGIGKGNQIEILNEMRFPHSLGMLYSAFAYYTGFKVNSGEYKLMGLAPYGEPKYKDLIYSHLIDLKEDGSFRMNMDYFSYCEGLTMTNKKFDNLFGGPPRKPESPVTKRDTDLARSIQDVTDEIVLKMARHVKKVTGMKNLCLAGGVALNCVANSKILSAEIFDDIWIQPASGDAGGSLGAALYGWYQYLGHERGADGIHDSQRGSFLGPEFSNDEIKSFLESRHIISEYLKEGELLDTVATLINNENVIGWFQGRMEFGPRALGNRSIIGDARSSKMQEVMNLKIKFRESFRPFAPSVLIEKVSDYFEFNHSSPYMLLVAQVAKNRIKKSVDDEKLFGIEKLKVIRSEIPAITHVDYSARLQTVHKETNLLYHKLISRFNEKYGCPVIVNTSFNVRGEPIVCSPEDAYRCFMRTKMDYLVLGNYLINKSKQKAVEDDNSWQKEFSLD